jgi:hypothetical protein
MPIRLLYKDFAGDFEWETLMSFSPGMRRFTKKANSQQVAPSCGRSKDCIKLESYDSCKLRYMFIFGGQNFFVR